MAVHPKEFSSVIDFTVIWREILTEVGSLRTPSTPGRTVRPNPSATTRNHGPDTQMSIQEQPAVDEQLDSEPEFELECLFDDMEEPTELTIFTPEGSATASEWITIDRPSAVSVTEIR